MAVMGDSLETMEATEGMEVTRRRDRTIMIVMISADT
jgi:hypothetical protein